MKLSHLIGIIFATLLIAGGVYSQSVTGVPSSNGSPRQTATGTAGGDLSGTYPNPTVVTTLGGAANAGGCSFLAAGLGSVSQCAGFYGVYNGSSLSALAATAATSSNPHPAFACIVNGSTDKTCRWVAGGVYAWTSGTTNAYDATLDTGLSRDAAGIIDVGNGTAGDKSGAIKGAYISPLATENGANNAIACAAGCGPTLTTGLHISIALAHSLAAGALTFAYNGGGALNIRSHRNPASNIASAYTVPGIIEMVYDGTQWEDLSQ